MPPRATGYETPDLEDGRAVVSESVPVVRGAGRNLVPVASVLVEQLTARGVDGIALTYVDNTGITRVKAVPTARLEAATTSGVGMSPVFDVFVLDDSVTASRTSTGPVGDLRLYPDLARLVELAAQPGWAWAPVDRRARSGEVHPLCHRSFATRMVAQAAEQGLSAAMSFEVEWALDAGSDGDFLPATVGPAYGMTRLIERSDYLRDLLRALAAEGISVEQVHPEYAAGQFEVSVAPNDPVGAADDSVLVRQTLRAVGYNHRLRTSFSPSVVAGHVGNGGHLHVSLWREGSNLFAGGPGPHGITAEAESFSAGILRELPALLVIGAPSVASYLRLIPQHWAGAFQTWGLENRETALRLVTGTAGHESRSANLEVKCFDLSANPYIVVGAVLAAGLAGIRDSLTLPPEIVVDPATLSPAELAAAGAAQLPTSLPDALERYAASTVLAEALGDPLHETIAAVRRAELALFADCSPEEVAAATRWRH
ncbi:MAG TPA: glutamine synthetase family protein [Acidimicrobiales bacterium]|nr:glutamine synthetase family protein [Acidimicrobiales bacterium]